MARSAICTVGLGAPLAALARRTRAPTGAARFTLTIALVAALATLARAGPGVAGVKHVHLVFANHLDVGYSSQVPGKVGTDADVLSEYMTSTFLRAMNTSEAVRSRGGAERYVYTTHPWLVSLYLDCPARIGIACPPPEDVPRFEAAVAGGDVTWHALPHNFQAEFMDVELLQYAVQLSHDLDQRFNLPPKRVMSQRDVPGLTRAAVPVLAGAGVAALSVGVNSGSAPPGVPKNTPFWWRDEGSGASLLAFWHPGGYSGVPVDSGAECVTAAGFDHALCAAWKQDNAGPHTAEEVLAIHEKARADFPGAAVAASTFDAFVAALEAAAPALDLPVVTQEIGDTWVYGVASDPAKVAEFRALLRLRRAEADRWDDPRFHAFSRLLLEIPEHTWGLADSAYPGDYVHWNNSGLAWALAGGNPRFQVAVGAWTRHRAYNHWAVAELGDTALGEKARAAMAELAVLKAPPAPAEPEFARAALGAGAPPLRFSSAAWAVELDGVTGAISGLIFKGSGAAGLALGRRGGAAAGTVWASPEGQLAKLMYSTYDEASFEPIWQHYAWTPATPWYSDFGKPNATVVGGATRRDAVPSLKKVWHRADSEEGGLKIVAQMEFDPGLVAQAGAPAAVHLEITSPAGSPDLFVDLIWENKTATRLPEAMWFGFQPPVSAVDPSSWRMSKLRQWVSPLEVMRNGSQSMHGVDDDGVSVASADGTALLRIRSLDAALVSPGRPTPFPSVVDPPDLTQGMHFCLVNNVWGTNYVMWFPYLVSDRNMRFRFVLQAETGVAET